MAYILTVIAEPAGVGGVLMSPIGIPAGHGQREYDAGTSVTLTVRYLVMGYRFDHWEGDASGINEQVKVTMNSNKTVKLVFSEVKPAPGEPIKPQTFRLTTRTEGRGTLYPHAGVYNKGDQIIILAEADTGYTFSDWSGDIEGSQTVPGTPNQLMLNMNNDRHIVATFVEIPKPVPTPPPPIEPMPPVPIPPVPVPPPEPIKEWVLTYGTVPQWPQPGKVSFSPMKSRYLTGDKVTLSATPFEGWDFSHWEEDLSGTSPVEVITIYQNTYVIAVFTEKKVVPIPLPTPIPEPPPPPPEPPPPPPPEPIPGPIPVPGPPQPEPPVLPLPEMDIPWGWVGGIAAALAAAFGYFAWARKKK